MAYKSFDTNTQVITQSKMVDVFPKCNSILFTNIGDTAVKVDEKILFPSTAPATILGDAIAFGGNEDEVYSRQGIQIVFVAPVGVSPQIEIVQKFFV